VYVIRDNRGYLICQVSNTLAKQIMDTVPGFFREYSVGSDAQIVYEITKNWNVNTTPELVVYLWSGSLVIPNRNTSLVIPKTD